MTAPAQREHRLQAACIQRSRELDAEDIQLAISGHEQALLDAVRLRDDARVGRLLRHAIGAYVRRCAVREVDA